MRILLTNDDGIHAPGIEALFDALQGPPALGEIVPIAPATVQSASSHGITFHDPLMCREVAVNDRMTGIAVEGRPADCVKLALRAIWQERFGSESLPDLTISGMNMGANVGINVIYSGTVAAAVESAFLGVPAIAVSLHLGGGESPRTIRYGRAAWIARQAINRVLQFPLDRHSVININIPRTETDDAPMPPIKVVQMNTAPGIDSYERRISPSGQLYYWITGTGMEFSHTAPESDVEALLERCVTITPLTYALTDYPRLQTWKERLAASSSPTSRATSTRSERR
jgi:5'-nucleotidase